MPPDRFPFAVTARRLPPWVAPVASVTMIAVAAALRLSIYNDRMMPIGFGVPLVLFAWIRSRRYLWFTAAGFATITLIKFGWILSTESPGSRPFQTTERATDIGLLLLDLFVIGALVHIFSAVREGLERRNGELDAANGDLAAREEDLARANEEMQSQAEELERQTEELLAANNDLAARERTLEMLLSLSRSLTADLTHEQAVERICETMGVLIGGPATASGIVERDADHIRLRCHHGFAGGPREEGIPVARSFAAVVLDRGRTGYIEDLSLRPDLSIPQPREGEPFVSVMASPLRVGGKPVGALEVYSRDRGPWNTAQTALIESLAAQASVSLEAAHLFERVRQERERLETVLRAAPIGIAVANADGSDVRLNPAGAAMIDVPVDENFAGLAVRGGLKRFVDGRPMAPDESPLVRAAREGVETRGLEVELVLPSGRRLFVLTDAIPIRDPGGRSVGAVSTFADITRQKELQRELDHRRREAEDASIRKTRFLAAVSHDIRTPANAISLLAELIRRSAIDPDLAGEVPELARDLYASAMSLVDLLTDVLDVARLDSGRIDIQETDFPLARVLTAETRQMRPLAREKGLELRVSAPAEEIHLRADHIKLSRVLGNLLGNAIKFTDRGHVRVEADPAAGGGVEIRVTDTGVGIPPEAQRHIFDEFFQVRNPERDRNKGTGLGLTICKRLVDAMGGRLDVHSAPGEGSTFTIALPPSCVVPAPECASGLHTK